MGMTTTLHTGKREATYDSRDFRYADLRPKTLALPNIPEGWGKGMDFGASGWGMLGNGPCDDGSITDQSSYAYNGAGDCAWAGPAHETMAILKDANGTVPKFTCKNVLDQYAQYLGLTDSTQLTSANDAGSDVRSVLQHRATTGLIDDSGTAHKIGVYVSLELGNWEHLREASYLFEEVGLGIQFATSAMDQFNANQMWTVVNGATIEGGHYVPIVGHPEPGLWTCITWGRRQLMTWSFLNKYADELWAYISLERYNSVTGQDAEGYKDVDLSRYLTMVATSATPSA
jgi:hypothetical protein